MEGRQKVTCQPGKSCEDSHLMSKLVKQRAWHDALLMLIPSHMM